MDVWQIALMIGALAVAAFNYDDRRALLWIGVGAADFIATAAYQAHPLPQVPHAFVTCVVDAGVAASIAIFGVSKWEGWVRRCFLLSMLFSVLYLLRVIDTRYVYVTSLEVANWLALICIGGAKVARLIDENASHPSGLYTRSGWASAVHRFRVHLDSPRSKTTLLSRAATRR